MIEQSAPNAVGWLAKVRRWMQSATNAAKSRELCLAAVKPDDKVLEIGPGEGYILQALVEEDEKRRLGLELHALDMLEAFLTRLPLQVHRHLFDLERLKNTINGVREMPLPSEMFDLVIFMEVIEHLPFPQIMISEIARVLKPGGQLIITTPNIFSLGNRVATLLGTDKIFRQVGSEGFISTIEYSPNGHVAHYSYQSLCGLLSPWFEIVRRDAADFHVPVLLYLQPIMTRWFKDFANHIVLLARRRPGETRLRIVPCGLNEMTELALPDGRCLRPMPHSRTCNACPHFHKDFLHPRDPRRRPGYIPTSR